MTVYVLQLNSYDADEVIGVFSSYEGAEKVREDFLNYLGELVYFSGSLSIMEVELDIPIDYKNYTLV